MGWTAELETEGSKAVQKWEYATVPLISHALQEILNQWGEEGWELVQVLESQQLGMTAFLKRPAQGADRASNRELVTLPEARATSRFPQQPHVGDGHGPLGSLHHVVDGECRHAHRAQRLHLDAGPLRGADQGLDLDVLVRRDRTTPRPPRWRSGDREE